MATNFVKASYTEVIDLQTVNGSTSIIGIHTPVGRRPYDRLMGFFNQFRKYRYKGISSLVMVPAANLPVDPLGLTGVQGTTDLMDPRDALNPILFHGAHGENLNMVLDTIYSSDERISGMGKNISVGGRNVSDSLSESKTSSSGDVSSYYKCLTDVTWKKFGIQSGVKLKGLHPLVHKMATNMPIVPGIPDANEGNTGQYVAYGADTNTGGISTPYPSNPVAYKNDLRVPYNTTPDVLTQFTPTSTTKDAAYLQQFTNGMQRLGWLPTTKLKAISSESDVPQRTIAALPKLFMGVLIMPPSYNVEQFMRCVIRHEFEFSGFTTSLGAMSGDLQSISANTSNSYFNWIDYGDTKVAEGESIDMIGGQSEVISDGVA